MDASTILSNRLHMQGLVNSSFKTPHDVVQSLGAVQAQEYAYAKWGLNIRIKKKNLTTIDIEESMTDGSILRTHVMRPTWHFVAPEDIRWMMMLTGPNVKKRISYYNKRLGLDDALFMRTNRILEKALRGNNYLTRKELDNILKKEGITTNVQKRAHIVSNAELDALICSGPLRGKQFTYALLEERVPHAKKWTREEALKELVTRYFASHGPATIQDFVWWSGLSTSDTKNGIERAKLNHEEVGEQTYWFTPLKGKAKDMHDTVFLLPIYDEYTIAYKNSRPLYYPPHPPSPVMRENVAFNHAILADGIIVGMWSRILSPKGITIRARIFSRLDAHQTNSLREEVERYGEFFHLPTKLDIV